MVSWILSSSMTYMYKYKVSLVYDEFNIETVTTEDTFFVVLDRFKINKLAKNSYVKLEVITEDTEETLIKVKPLSSYTINYWNIRRVEIYKFREMARHVNGRQALFFKKRSWGLRCDCVDQKLEEQLGKDNCNKCYGTGFIAGYFEPVNLYVKIIGEDAKQVRSNIGKVLTSSQQFQTYGLPQVTQGDFFLFEDTDETFMVSNSVVTHTAEIPSLQIIKVTKYNFNDAHFVHDKSYSIVDLEK
jgi:hypothetical protein